jgi:putative hydrolase of the HAD superfamily
MNSTDKITTLFLDIGGVLLTNGWDRRARKMAAEHFGLDYADLDERHHLTYDAYESGKVSLDEYLARIVFHEPRTFTPESFKEFMFAQSKPYPETIELIRRVKDKYRLKIAVVSNEGRELSVHRVRKFDLGSFVDFFVCSSFVHCRKPDPDIYRIALDIAQVSPRQVLYIEDRLVFVEVARGLDLHCLHHVTYEGTLAALKSFGFTL